MAGSTVLSVQLHVEKEIVPDLPSCIVSLASMLTGVTLPGAAAAAGAALDANELPAAPRAPATTISRLVTSLDVPALCKTSHRTCRDVAINLHDSPSGKLTAFLKGQDQQLHQRHIDLHL